MNYATIKYNDISNGPGVRTSLYVSGCTHHCPNCFNEIAWDFQYGQKFTEETAEQILKSCAAGYIGGLSLLGGEPMEPTNQEGLLDLVKKFKETFPDKTIWCYSGYTYEQLTGLKDSRCRCQITDRLLEYLDVLVDGPFIQDLYEITLRFRGSKNQRIIDLNRTRNEGKLVLWQDNF